MNQDKGNNSAAGFSGSGRLTKQVAQNALNIVVIPTGPHRQLAINLLNYLLVSKYATATRNFYFLKSICQRKVNSDGNFLI